MSKKLIMVLLVIIIIVSVGYFSWPYKIYGEDEMIELSKKTYIEKNIKRAEKVLNGKGINFKVKKIRDGEYGLKVKKNQLAKTVLILKDNGLLKQEPNIEESAINNQFQRRMAQKQRKITLVTAKIESKFSKKVKRLSCPKYYSNLKQCTLRIWGRFPSEILLNEIKQFASKELKMEKNNLSIFFTKGKDTQFDTSIKTIN